MAPADFKVVAIAASAGGLKALSQVLGALPGSFAGALVVVQHLDPRHRSMLADILARRSALRVIQSAGGERIAAGIAYIAPPDRHMLVDPDGTLELTRTKLVHFVRPSADLLFESCAASFGPRAIGVVLSGSGSDGAMGVKAIKAMRGTVIVQEPSEFTGMPGAALETGAVDMALPLDKIAPMLENLVSGRVAA